MAEPKKEPEKEKPKKETEAEAILKIIKDPLFEEGIKMGTVPTTPRRVEKDGGPETDKHKTPKK